MNIIFLNGFCKKKGSVDICAPQFFGVVFAGLLLLLGGAGFGGYLLGSRDAAPQQDPRVTDALAQLQRERQSIRDMRNDAQANLDALAKRLGSLQAQMLRLNALGERLVEVGQLDAGEFDFAAEPAVGGADARDEAYSVGADDLVLGMRELQHQLVDKEKKLDLLQELLLTNQMQSESTPSGWPLEKGWISSRFGKRIDPKTGKKALHHGIDFAGKRGSNVITVASGVVVRSERQAGFGNMVEVRHPDGYSTLYAHNEKNLVKVGDVVKKGDPIALLGSSGRSTGPHVHFELRKDKRYLNPNKVVRKRQ